MNQLGIRKRFIRSLSGVDRCSLLCALHSLGREGEETEKKAVKIVDIS